MTTTVDMSGDTIYVANIVSAVAPGNLTGGFIPGYEYVTATGITTTAGSTTIYVQPNDGYTYQVAGATVTFSTASTSGTITVNVDTGTNAPGAGTAQLTAAISMSGTANTPVNGTMIASPTSIPAGARISYTTAGTLTNLAGAVLTVYLKRIV